MISSILYGPTSHETLLPLPPPHRPSGTWPLGRVGLDHGGVGWSDHAGTLRMESHGSKITQGTGFTYCFAAFNWLPSVETRHTISPHFCLPNGSLREEIGVTLEAGPSCCNDIVTMVSSVLYGRTMRLFCRFLRPTAQVAPGRWVGRGWTMARGWMVRSCRYPQNGVAWVLDCQGDRVHLLFCGI